MTNPFEFIAEAAKKLVGDLLSSPGGSPSDRDAAGLTEEKRRELLFRQRFEEREERNRRESQE
jgi:hypothetical protein